MLLNLDYVLVARCNQCPSSFTVGGAARRLRDDAVSQLNVVRLQAGMAAAGVLNKKISYSCTIETVSCEVLRVGLEGLHWREKIKKWGGETIVGLCPY